MHAMVVEEAVIRVEQAPRLDTGQEKLVQSPPGGNPGASSMK